MTRKAGFTLIELLVVIAIIGILAAIIFPVFARAKESAYRGSDMSNLNSIRSALQLYRADQGAYPPALLGYVNTYSGDPLGTDVIPADQLKGALYPRRVDSIKTLTPALEKSAFVDTTTAVWPNQDPRAVGSAPIVDTNGNGAIASDDDIPEARQAYGPGTIVQRPDPTAPLNTIAARFYNVSGYDTALVKLPAGTQRELHYTLFWTQAGLGSGSVNDDPRQLGYTDPPETTVVTWDSYFRDYTNGVPDRAKKDIVLFLGGTARAFDSKDVSDRSWRVMP